MHIGKQQASACRALLVVCLLWFSAASVITFAAPPGQSILPLLEERFGLSEQQVRDALGALLVFTRERLPKTQFDELARTIPNADLAMQEVKLRGIVTKPIDDLSEYESALGNSGISPASAAAFAPAVLEALHATGHDRERDILARVLN